MAPKIRFRNDFYEKYKRKCLVFPSESAEPRLPRMTIRATAPDDAPYAKLCNRTVDLLETYGSEYTKLRSSIVSPTTTAICTHKYLVYYNLSPKLPPNRCIARIVGINPDTLGQRLFWRGDVVVVKFESQDDTYIKCVNANHMEMLMDLEAMLRDAYRRGSLERELNMDEMQWQDYCLYWSGWTITLFATLTGDHLYWGQNWREKEADFLDCINELRLCVGRDPITRTSSSSISERASATICKTLLPFFSSDYFITGPPIFPLGVEHRIFETCARNNPKSCLQLVLVARRVREWIEPILYETLHMRDVLSPTSTQRKLETFIANIDSKPPDFYSKHVKNIWIATSDLDAFKRILTVCSGVQNLVLFPVWSGFSFMRDFMHPFIPFLEHVGSSSCLRRLSCRLEYLFELGVKPNFSHACFANLTHLHIYDEAENWSTYMGFENLHSLTHLAFTGMRGPQDLAAVMPTLPALQYVALCHYETHSDFSVLSVNNKIPLDVYGIRVVWIDGLTEEDWKRGATGRGDFWDLVEQEVSRRYKDLQVGNAYDTSLIN